MKIAVIEKRVMVVMFVIVVLVFAFAQHNTEAIEKKYFNTEASSVSAETHGQHSAEKETKAGLLLSPEN